MIVVIIISAGWPGSIEVNTDIQAFREVVGDAAQMQRSYTESLKHQKAAKDNTTLADRKTFEVQLYYEAKEGSVFSEAALRDIRALENLLRNMEGWKRMCAMSDENARFRCEPGESLGNYAWPKRQEVHSNAHTPFTLKFNGESGERLPVHAFLTYLNERKPAPHELKKFMPHQFSSATDDSTLLRTIFAFTAPSLDSTAFEAAYQEFVAEELFPALKNATERAQETPDDPWIEPWSIRLYFRGHDIEAHEVRYYLEGDLKFAIGALVITLVATWLQLRSFFLAVLGLAQVCVVPLVAYVTVSVSLEKLSLASFLCIFLVIGLSSNDLLAVKEYWSRVGREVGHMYPSNPGAIGYKDELERYYTARLSRTFQALFFRFLPQFMTMVSWLVFLTSLIRPIREFGIFMFTCTAYACCLCVGMFPPLLVVHEAYIQPFIHRGPRILAMILEPRRENFKFPWRPIARKCLLLAEKRRAKLIWAGTAGVTLIIFIITVVVAVNSETPGLPEVYSPAHHGNAGRPLIETFMPTSPALVEASQDTLVCDPFSSDTTGCGLHWCEAPQASTATTTTPAPGSSIDHKCICHQPATTGLSCDYAHFTPVVSGNTFWKANDTTRLSSVNTYVKATFPSSLSINMLGSTGSLLSSLVLEHWESGATNVEAVVKMPVAEVKLKNVSAVASTSNTCIMQSICYCGNRLCTVTATGKRQVDGPVLPAGALVSTADTNSAAQLVKEVIIVFGITAEEGNGFLQGDHSWSFDNTFEPVSPWAQRAMLKMCNNIPASFAVVESHCWINDFRIWMIAQGEQFPTQRFSDFQSHLKRFLKEKSSVPITALWHDINDDMVATAFAFKVPPKVDASASDILAGMQAWHAYVATENTNAATSASKAFATSSFWADAEAQHEAMSNAWDVALLALGICILSCLLYTWDFAFSGIVIVVAFIAMVYLSFFMFCLFGWAVGPWEVILLVAYLMYSVEPALRVGRGTVWGDYLESETRLSSNAVAPLPALMPPASDALAIQDAPGTGVPALNPDAPDGEGSSNNSPRNDAEDARARSAFEGRMHTLVLNNSNAVFGSAVKLVLCGILALPTEFRLFTRLGAVTIMVPLISLPCIFILVPTALVLFPIREKPDLVTLSEKIIEKINANRDDS
jgi:hypothetical protein